MTKEYCIDIERKKKPCSALVQMHCTAEGLCISSTCIAFMYVTEKGSCIDGQSEAGEGGSFRTQPLGTAEPRNIRKCRKHGNKVL